MTCPHVWTADEGTSGCDLANITAKQWVEMLEEIRLIKEQRDAALADAEQEIAALTRERDELRAVVNWYADTVDGERAREALAKLDSGQA